jgi:hypothetical protein
MAVWKSGYSRASNQHATIGSIQLRPPLKFPMARVKRPFSVIPASIRSALPRCDGKMGQAGSQKNFNWAVECYGCRSTNWQRTLSEKRLFPD